MDEFPVIDTDTLNLPSNFTGLLESRWPNGQLRYRGQFADGVEIGQHVRFWEDGTVAQIQWYDSSGCPRGTTLNFYRDGDKCNEECFDDPERRKGTFLCRDYDANGDVTSRTEYCEFELIDQWRRPDLDSDPETQIAIDRIVANAIRELVEKVGHTDDDDEEDDEPEE